MSRRNRGVPDLKRGDVWLVDFEPWIGGGISKTRPAVIVTNDVANAVLNHAQVVPISNQVDHLYPAEASVTLNGQRRKAMADQLMTASKQRLLRLLGRLDASGMTDVERVVRLQLGL